MKNFLRKTTTSNKIEFIPTGAQYVKNENELDFLDPPKPSRNFIPDWYKEATLFKGMARIKESEVSELPPAGFKSCAAFIDGMTLGYTLTTWTDIYFLKSDLENQSGSKLEWKSHIPPLEVRDTDLNPTLPIPMGCSPTHLAWKMQWGLKLPEGYSAFYTHPVNRYDLPFVTLTGVIDNDKFFSGGNVPVFFKKDFYGKIPAGTPYLQVFPFKRENWKSAINKEAISEVRVMQHKARNVHIGWYKKNCWSKKSFD